MQGLLNINKPNKQFLYVCLLLSICLASNAQLSISTGYSLSSLSPRGFVLFAESYNSYHKNELATQLKNFNPGQGIEFHCTWQYSEAGTIAAGYNRLFSSTNSSFKNGDSRQFNQILSFMNIELGGKKEFGKISLFGGFGMEYGNSQISSYYKNSDNTINTGINKLLNGNYNGKFKALFLSIKPVYYFTNSFGIFIKITGFHYFKPKVYNDPDNAKIIGNPRSDYISTDYQHINEIYNYFADIPEQYQLKTELRGIRFSLGIQYYFKYE